jgi:hypothetical protein
MRAIYIGFAYVAEHNNTSFFLPFKPPRPSFLALSGYKGKKKYYRRWLNPPLTSNKLKFKTV